MATSNDTMEADFVEAIKGSCMQDNEQEGPISVLAGQVAVYQARAAFWVARCNSKDEVIAVKDEMITLLKEQLGIGKTIDPSPQTDGA